jgi:hypothetical protein
MTCGPMCHPLPCLSCEVSPEIGGGGGEVQGRSSTWAAFGSSDGSLVRTDGGSPEALLVGAACGIRCFRVVAGGKSRKEF